MAAVRTANAMATRPSHVLSRGTALCCTISIESREVVGSNGADVVFDGLDVVAVLG